LISYKHKCNIENINILTSDFRRTMKIKECCEKLVDLREECPDVSFEIANYLNQGGDKPTEAEDAHFVRSTVATMINNAQAALPQGLKLLVRCGYRTPDVQARQYKKDYAALRSENPTWNTDKLDLEIIKRTDPPDIGPHCTGGAIDLSISDENGYQLDMGAPMGAFNLDNYTYSDTISSDVEANRQILISTMTNAGFLNFPAEWWHWSYVDREWAFAHDQDAFYGAVEQRFDELQYSYQETSNLSPATSGAF